MTQESLLDSNWNIGDEISATELNQHGQEHQNLGSDGGFAEDVIPAAALKAHPLSYDPGMTEWAAGLVNQEVNRIALGPAETLVVERVEFRRRGGTQDPDASVTVRDATTGDDIATALLGETIRGPGTTNTGSIVVVQLTNQIGNSITAAPRVQGYITSV